MKKKVQKSSRSSKWLLLLSLLVLLSVAGAALLMAESGILTTKQAETDLSHTSTLSDNTPSSSPVDSVEPAKELVSSVPNSACYSSVTSSQDATVVSNSSPQMYGFEGGNGPKLGLTYHRCVGTIIINLTGDFDYYKVYWWRPGRDVYTQYQVSKRESIFNNAHAGTSYKFTVKGCYSHWYGDSCKGWSPIVKILTTK
jgi:hypothetical protein